MGTEARPVDFKKDGIPALDGLCKIDASLTDFSDYNCNIEDASGVQFEYIKFPTDMNIVKDDGGGGLQYFLHITLADAGDSACGIIGDIWNAIGGEIPGGAIFGSIFQGACR